MALFHVARFCGAEAAGPGEAEAAAGDRARALLARLQSRALERQRQRREAAPAEAAEAAGRRRRRPRRRRGAGEAAGNPDARPAKRRKAGGDVAGPREAEAAAEDGPPCPTPLLAASARSRAAQVQPFLPGWLAQPSRVRRDVTESLTPLEDVPEVHPDLQRKLRAQGIFAYFPVQAAVIPALLEGAAGGFLVGRGGYRPSDLCVCAPTGSGKTLAFVIPVVQALLHRVVCHIRALVVLPTKELAQQVSKVFHVYTDATSLRVALITGHKSLAKEQESLTQRTTNGYRSLADIVVATPGRLVDHIDQTPGFCLQQLRFLVIDEADRMVDSMHQSWLPRVVAAAFWNEGPAEPGGMWQRGQPQAVTVASTCCPQVPLQKLLFSATLTQDPEKLQRLGLYQPRLFSSGQARGGPRDDEQEQRGSAGKYAFPVGLTHHYVPCRLRSKPLVILHLLLQRELSRVLCFTNSRENSHRLFLLLQAFGGVSVAEFSSRYGPGQRRDILKQFEQGKIQLLVSTDAAARGIDVQGVELVVNYDAPQYLRTYVHRVGRTARAGKTGQAFTLLLKVQERRFLRMLDEAGAPELQRHETPSELLQPLIPQYEAALSQLEETVREERKQKAV